MGKARRTAATEHDFENIAYQIAVENIVHIRDLLATVLHLLGIASQRISVKFQGLDMRLTSVELSQVGRKILT